jgi:hypothetical protein
MSRVSGRILSRKQLAEGTLQSRAGSNSGEEVKEEWSLGSRSNGFPGPCSIQHIGPPQTNDPRARRGRHRAAPSLSQELPRNWRVARDATLAHAPPSPAGGG